MAGQRVKYEYKSTFPIFLNSNCKLLKKKDTYRKVRKNLKAPLGNFRIIQIIEITRIIRLKRMRILVITGK
jgi:hypothetical protein